MLYIILMYSKVMEGYPEKTRAKRKRGAQPGNRNALKHGFYASKFSQQELASLDTLQIGLVDEIILLRLMMRRVVEQAGAQESTLDEWSITLQRLSLVANRLARLLKIHQELTGEKEDNKESVFQAFRDMMAKKGWTN